MSDIGDKFLEGVTIETPHGYVPFDGIRKYPKTEIYKFELESGDHIECSLQHTFVISGEEIEASSLREGDFLETKNGKSKITSIEYFKTEEVFDVLGVSNEDSSYFANDIKHHNCSFTGSTHTLIDGDVLERMIGKEPILIPEDGYYIWKRPEQNRLYLFGVDVAKGSNNDYHVINIFDVTYYGTTGRIEQVAMFHKNDIDLFSFIEKIKIIASQWGNPPIIVENNHLGSVVCTELFESEYENLFYDYEKGEYGVNANIKTKPLACSYLKQDIEESRMVINSEILVSELGFFEEVRKGVFEARKGNAFHDDTVSSAYWVSYCLRSRFFEDFLHYVKENNPGVIKEITNVNSEMADDDILSSFFGGFNDNSFDSFQNDLTKI